MTNVSSKVQEFKFKKIIKKVLDKQKLSQEKCAELIGMKSSTFNDHINKNSIRADVLKKLSVITEKSMHYLCYGTEDENACCVVEVVDTSKEYVFHSEVRVKFRETNRD